MKKILIIVILLVIGLGIYWFIKNNDSGNVAEGPVDAIQSPIVSNGEPEPGSTDNELPIEPAAAKAKAELATKLAVDEKSIVIMQITETEWSDGCLGLGGPAESCLQALVPGFKVELLAKGKTYIYRTDKTGDAIRTETE